MTCYLDVRSGRVEMIFADTLVDDGVGLSRDEIEEGLERGDLIRVEPLGSVG
jgi:hypothetical protein